MSKNSNPRRELFSGENSSASVVSPEHEHNDNRLLAGIPACTTSMITERATNFGHTPSERGAVEKHEHSDFEHPLADPEPRSASIVNARDHHSLEICDLATEVFPFQASSKINVNISRTTPFFWASASQRFSVFKSGVVSRHLSAFAFVCSPFLCLFAFRHRLFLSRLLIFAPALCVRSPTFDFCVLSSSARLLVFSTIFVSSFLTIFDQGGSVFFLSASRRPGLETRFTQCPTAVTTRRTRLPWTYVRGGVGHGYTMCNCNTSPRCNLDRAYALTADTAVGVVFSRFFSAA